MPDGENYRLPMFDSTGPREPAMPVQVWVLLAQTVRQWRQGGMPEAADPVIGVYDDLAKAKAAAAELGPAAVVAPIKLNAKPTEYSIWVEP